MKKTQKTIIIFFFTSIFFPLLIQFLGKIAEVGFMENPFLEFLIYVAVSFSITAVVLLLISATQFFSGKKLSFEETNKKIQSICDCFNYNKGQNNVNMFQLTPENEMIKLTTNAYDANIKPKKKNEKKKNIIYYAFSAKEYLNWIDFVYLKFLKRIKDSLNCKIIIVLHFPDEIKECKINNDANFDPNSLLEKYKKIVKDFSEFIFKIIGKDTKIMQENDFYKLNVEKYAEDFHNIYISSILYYANQIGKKDFDYKKFKRRVSHIESAFPMWMISLKSKHNRIYVLDNKLSQEVWKMKPFHLIRERNNINFIEVISLCKENGERIDVHHIDNVCNLTDSKEILMRKIHNTDESTKEIMLSLINEAYTSSVKVFRGYNVDKELFDSIVECIKIYKLQNDDEFNS